MFFLSKRAESEHKSRYRESQPLSRATHRQITFRERLNANVEARVPHCLQGQRAFPHHSTQSFPRCVVWPLWPGLGAGTENQYQTELDQSSLRRAASEARDRVPR